MKRLVALVAIALIAVPVAVWAANAGGVMRLSATKGIEVGAPGMQFTANDDVPSDGKLAIGRLYYDTTDGLAVYNGSAWSTLAAGGPGSLDHSYDYGSPGGGRSVTVDSGSVMINLSDSTNDYALTVDVPVTGTIDDAITITTSHGSGVFTDGLDASDAGLVTAVNIGDNGIAGTAFSVTAGTGAFVITDNTANVTPSIASTHAGAAGVILKLEHDSASPAANDVSAKVSHYGDDDGGNSTEYSKIEFQTEAVADASEGSSCAIHVMNAGTLTEELTVNASGVTATTALTVTAGGATITAGSVALADGVITQTDALATGNPMLSLTNTHAGAAGVEVSLIHNSSSPADDDVVASIIGYGEDSGSASTGIAKIAMELTDFTNASEDGTINFSVMDGGTLEKTFVIGAGTAQAGADLGINVAIFSDDTGAVGPGLKFHFDSASPANNDVTARLGFYADDDAGTSTEIAKIDVKQIDVGAASDDAEIEFYTMKAGTNTEVANIAAAGLTVVVGALATSDGGMTITDDITTDLVRFDNTGGAIATGNAILELDAGGNIASGGAMLLFSPTGTPAAGSIALSIAGGGDNIIGINADVDAANNHGYSFNIGGATASGKAGFYITHDGDPASGNEAVFHVEYSGTGTNNPVTAKFESSDAVNDVQILVTNAGAAGAILRMQHDQTGTGAGADDVAARIDIYSDNDAAQATQIGTVDFTIEDVADGTEEGSIIFSVMDAGTLEPTLYVGTTGTGVDDGANVMIYTDADAATGAGLKMVADRGANQADDDVISRIDFYGDDSTNAETQYGKIDVILEDETDASEDGNIVFYVMDGGTLEESVRIGDRNPASADAGAQLQIYSNDGGATGPGLKFVFEQTATGAGAADVVGRLDFYGDSDNATERNFGRIDAKATDISDGAEDGEFEISVMKAGSLTKIVEFDSVGPIGGRIVSLPFYYDNAAAAQTDLQLYAAGGTQTTQIEYVMPWAGSVIGISVGSSAATRQDDAAFEPSIDGTGTGLTATLDAAGDTQYTSATQADGADTFTADQRIGVEVTSHATFAPDGSSEIQIMVWVEIG